MSKTTAFVVGLVGGVLAGWYATKKYYKTKCDMELQSMRELCDRAEAAAKQRATQAEEKAQKAADDRAVFADALVRLGYTGDGTSHTAPARDIQEESGDEPVDPAELETPTEEELQRIEQRRKQPPVLIDEQIFSGDIYSGFEKKEVLWFPADEVLLDGDNNELMDDPYSFLGTEWKPIIEETGEAYVRNFRWDVDYLVLRCEGLGSENMSLPE